MKIHKVSFLLLILLPAAVLISACSPIAGISNGSSSITVLELLQNSATAMKGLKSAHIDTTTAGSLQALGSSSTTLLSQSFSITGSGDEALPAEEALQVSITHNNSQPANLAEIVQGNKVYVQNARGQWYVMDKSVLQGLTGNPFAGLSGVDPTDLLGLLEDTEITDHGDQSLNGVTLRHITIAFDKAAFKKILDNDPQLRNLFGQQNVDAVLNSTKVFSSSLDLWIDESTFYVHRTELKFNLNEDVSSLSQSVTPVVVLPLPAGVITSFDSTFDLSKFNTPVTITPPANAIPTNNPVSIFS